MSLASNLQTALTRVGTEFKSIRTLIGGSGTATISSLTTTDKTSLVAAINEVKAASSGAPPDATETVKGIVELATTVEASAGVDTVRAVTPAGVAASISGKANTSSLATVATSGSAADLTGVLPTASLPPLAISQASVVATQAAMLALTAERGDVAIRTDNGKTYILATDSPTTLADWKEITASGAVQSVAGKTGTVTLVSGDVGLGSVDNTSDAAKPVSTATSTALSGKQPLDTDLTAIAALASAADKLPYSTGTGTWALTAFTTAGRALVDDADATAQRATLAVYSTTEIGDPTTDFSAGFVTALS